jgi:hypothetical protein
MPEHGRLALNAMLGTAAKDARVIISFGVSVLVSGAVCWTLVMNRDSNTPDRIALRGALLREASIAESAHASELLREYPTLAATAPQATRPDQAQQRPLEWVDVGADPRYQRAPAKEQARLRARYWDEFVAHDPTTAGLTDAQRMGGRTKFVYKPLEQLKDEQQWKALRSSWEALDLSPTNARIAKARAMLLFEEHPNVSGADAEVWEQRHDLSAIAWRTESTPRLVMKTGFRGVLVLIVAFLGAFSVLWVGERSWAVLLERRGTRYEDTGERRQTEVAPGSSPHASHPAAATPRSSSPSRPARVETPAMPRPRNQSSSDRRSPEAAKAEHDRSRRRIHGR